MHEINTRQAVVRSRQHDSQDTSTFERKFLIVVFNNTLIDNKKRYTIINMYNRSELNVYKYSDLTHCMGMMRLDLV